MARPTKIAYAKCSKQKMPNELKLENIVNGTESQEMRQTAKKVEAYKKMLANYRNERMIDQDANSTGSV